MMGYKPKEGCGYFATAFFLACLISSVFTLNAEPQVPFYNPFSPNLLYNSIGSPPGYLSSPVIQPSQAVYPQGISYIDYYASYPYIPQQNYSYNTGIPYINGSGGYLPNNAGYIPGISQPLTVYNPYQNYQSAQGSNYSVASSGNYQTVSFYPSTNNSNTQTQTYQPNSVTYTPGYVPVQINSGAYFPAAQNGYYTPAAPQIPNIYIPFPSNVPNISQPIVYNNYYPANPYAQNQYSTYQYPAAQPAYSGYYVPNSNYWPNAEIDETEPADIEGAYKGEWASETTGDDGDICGEIEQDGAKVSGEFKLKEYVIEVEGKAPFTGTVIGNTVTLEIDLSGPVLEFVGTVQSNGDITGAYIVESSTGSIIDKGTLTLEPK
ncbi:hypothetical protein JXL19_10715 [bacterium]|nr:hypothetical protein [bacterium]